ncbi:choline/ethanolamine kinase [Achlya hypogyna]|uniref:Choline/ethanolamine kinase n=1 Tax=Achlya hypogyna TaxID=1202772 RepID=A0A1V9Z1M8_ACHHY|nr:choline/ethanolamine kinase [Achlya hypogyna]
MQYGVPSVAQTIALSLADIPGLADPTSVLRQDVASVLKALVPGWHSVAPHTLELTHLSGGHSNLLLACATAEAPEEKVVLRIYGVGTELFYARDDEIKTYRALAELPLGVGLVGLFANGRVETWIDGRPLTAFEMREPALSVSIARKLRALHDVDIPQGQKTYALDKVHHWFSLAQARYTEERVDWVVFGRDVALATELVAAVPSPVVFGHNDVNCGNVLLAGGDIVLIDFEYSHANPRGVDIANHFTEWCYFFPHTRPELGDPAKYPTAAEQRRFAQAYLGEDCEAAAVDELLLEVLVHGLVAHLHWALWAFLQAATHDGTFRYEDYALDRWRMFAAQRPCAIEAVAKRTEQRLATDNVGNQASN